MSARTSVEARRIASPALRALMSRRTAELVALALGILGLALLVALVTYDPRDPSLNTATDRHVANLAGSFGASVADILLQGFGIAGLLPGVALLAWAWGIGSHRGLGSVAGRIAALLGAMPVLAGVLAAFSPRMVAWPTVAGPGGAIGSVLAGAALGTGRGWLGPFGMVAAWLVGVAMAVALVPLALGLSASEWRAGWRFAGRSARVSFVGGRGAARIVVRGAHGVGSASGWLTQTSATQSGHGRATRARHRRAAGPGHARFPICRRIRIRRPRLLSRSVPPAHRPHRRARRSSRDCRCRTRAGSSLRSTCWRSRRRGRAPVRPRRRCRPMPACWRPSCRTMACRAASSRSGRGRS